MTKEDGPVDWLTYYRLKSLPRQGWLRKSIPFPESVAAHSWGLALLCSHYCPNDLNKSKVLELALLHDLPEVLVGDITPHDGVSKEEKHQKEEAAAFKLLPSNSYAIWKEYQENISLEAQFVHSMDKIDMAIQAIFYAEQYDIDTSEFISSAKNALAPHFKYLWKIVEKVCTK